MSLCAVCETEGSGTSCARCGGALALNGRFVLERLLGAGGQSRVYAGRDTRDGSVVAVKIMAFERVREWKNVELFRRAANVLRGLDHAGIPRLIDYFEETRPSHALYCLVHEYIDGETLAQAMEHGLRLDEHAARALLVELCKILVYLHGLSPPVIHRDIKPANLMRRKSGGLVLIDFDLVRDVMEPGGGETTTAGSAGYTPLEQYTGEALPASDVYAAGVTLAVLLSRKDPLALRGADGQHLDVSAHVHVSAALVRVLDKMVEPDLRKRYRDAGEVLAELERPAPPARSYRVPIAVGGAALLSVALLLVTRVASTPASAPPPPPAPARPVAARPAPAIPAPIQPPTATTLKDPTATMLKDPAAVAHALAGSRWQGKAGHGRIQLRFVGSERRLKAELTSFDETGSGRTLTPLTVEIAPLGTLTLRAHGKEDGVDVERSFYGDLSGDGQSISGTRESRYDSAGSSYVTDEAWSVQRTLEGK